MPKIVDQKARRAHVAEAAVRVIARDSFEGMNMRAVAKEAGISYGSLFHYFESKEAVLLETVQHVINGQEMAFTSAKHSVSPLQTLTRLLVEDTVVNGKTFDAHAVWISFLAQSIYNKRLAERHKRIHELWLSTLENFLDNAKKRDEIRKDVNCRDEAIALWVLCAGISQRALLNPKSLPVRKQKSLIRDYLSKLRS